LIFPSSFLKTNDILNKEFIDNLIASKQIPEDAKDTIVKAFSREADEAFPDLPTAKEQQPRK
jgi:hypothetical protein